MIEAELHDGRVLEFPDGTDPAVIQRTVRKVLGVKTNELAPFEKGAQRELSYTTPELIAGAAPTRFALGAASPFLGAAQMVANSPLMTPGNKIVSAVTGEDFNIGQSVNEKLAQLEEMKKRGMQAYGQEGADIVGLGGTVMSPPFLKAGSVIGSTPGYLNKVAQGAAVGGGAAAMTPVTEGDYETGKQEQMAVGGTIGAAIPAVGVPLTKVAKGAYHLVEPWFNEAAIKGRAFLEAAGDKADDIIRLLRQNKQIVPGSAPTAGEAAVPAASTEFSALQKGAEKVQPTAYLGRQDAQNAARLAAVRSVGKDEATLNAAKATRAANASENYGAVINDLINPKSDTRIMLEAIEGRHLSKAHALRDQGRFATRAAEQTTLANKWTPVPGQPRVPGRLSANIERVPEAQAAARDAAEIAKYRQKELAFLENTMQLLKQTVGLDETGLSQFLNRPSMKAAVQDAIKGAQETGSYFPKKAGDRFSVKNLQRMKESLDDMVKDPATFGIKATEAVEINNTRSAFIKWLSNKSPGWEKARLQYSADSHPINQMQIGQYLEQKLVPALSEESKQRASVFAEAMRNAPSTIKKATGAPRFETLKEALDPQALQAVESVQQDLARGVRLDLMAAKGQFAGKKLEAIGTESMESALGGKPPTLLHRGMMLVNHLLNRAEGRLNERLAKDLALEMLDPPKVGETMKQARARQLFHERLVKEMNKYRIGGIAGASVGTLKEIEANK